MKISNRMFTRAGEGEGRCGCRMTLLNDDPPHREMIGDALVELGISISAAARSLGVTRQQIHNVIAGRSSISPEMALRLENFRQFGRFVASHSTQL